MLKDGEVKCFKCDGSGTYIHNTCPYCVGKGYVDWVTNAMSMRKRLFRASFSTTSANEIHDFKQEGIMEMIAAEIAKEIDKEILASLSDPLSLKKNEKYVPRIYTKENKFDY